MSVDPLTMTTAEAAVRLGVTADWLGRMASAGRIPSRKVGNRRRFTEQDLLDYLDSVREGVVDPAAAAGTPRSRQRRRAS